MSRFVLLDAGPLVALVYPGDAAHERCSRQLEELDGTLITSWAVLAEAAWIVRKNAAAVAKLLEGGETGVYQIANLEIAALPRVRQLMNRYSSAGIQLADATLIYLAELKQTDMIFTLDRRDFSIYKFARNRSFHIVPEA